MSVIASTDRILVLETIDDKKPLSSTGLVDSRLFTGENKLHAIKDIQTNLWSLKYEKGIVPIPLKGKYTGFKALRNFCESYFNKRNMRIKEIID